MKRLKESLKKTLSEDSIKTTLRKKLMDIFENDFSEEKLDAFIADIPLAYIKPLLDNQQVEDLIYRKIDSLITSVDEIVFEIDNDCKIIRFWCSDESYLWSTREDFLNKEIQEFIPDPLGQDLKNTILKVQESRKPAEIEYQSPYGDGNYYIARLNLIQDENPNKKHVTVLIHNITDRKKAEQELIEAKKAAEEALTAKAQFLSSISHEIRTPMNAIIGLTDILIAQTSNKTSLEYLKSIKYASDNLLVLINDILDFSKADAGKIQFEQIDFDLHEQITAIEKIYQLKAKEKQITFISTIEDKIPQHINGDPYRLNQILTNLISNSIKFTDEGHVQLYIFSKEVDEKNLLLQFKITDTGIGISPDMHDKIFDIFEQAKTDTSRRYGGTGLGLAITKTLVQQQGGSIMVESEEGTGSSFTVELPFKKSKFIKSPTPVDKKENYKLFNINVLIVEDNILNQLVVKKILDTWNVQYTVVEHGQKAIEILETQKFDVVLMDLQMPVMNGFEATKIIRDKNTTVLNPEVPIIALTADAFPATKTAVLAAGMNDFISKPFKKEALLSKIKKYG